MSEPENSNTDKPDTWRCGSCGHTESSDIDEIVGEKETKVVGQGRREKEITTVVCPSCGSSDWHSDSIAQAFLNRSKDTDSI